METRKVFKQYEMLIYDSNVQKESFEQFVSEISVDYEGLIFNKTGEDTVGNSGCHSIWGDVYEYSKGKISFDGTALYKDHDYDNPLAPYAEKVWSIMGQIMLSNCRIPNNAVILNRG